LDSSGVPNSIFSTEKRLQEINLKSMMDESEIASQAVNLNLKLMKWRMLPNLNLEKINSCKVLIFGAGTLGCQLARYPLNLPYNNRNLIGWGVKNISFIDYGKVSYSNPVR